MDINVIKKFLADYYPEGTVKFRDILNTDKYVSLWDLDIVTHTSCFSVRTPLNTKISYFSRNGKRYSFVLKVDMTGYEIVNNQLVLKFEQ